jgi:hypothetical protein
MPRLNIEDNFWIEIADLYIETGDKDKAIGNVVRFLRFAQDRFKRDRIITEKDFIEQNFLPGIKHRFAEEIENGCWMAKGAEKHFKWIKNRQKAGRSGGIASRKSVLNKINTLSSSKNNHLQPSSSSSSSSSLSYSKEKKRSSAVTEKFDAQTAEPIAPAKRRCRTTPKIPLPEKVTPDWIQKTLTPEQVKNLKTLYPDADFVRRCFIRMAIWIENNRQRCHRNQRGWYRTIDRWLATEWKENQEGVFDSVRKGVGHLGIVCE